jgi:D-beta-D-heptose 7-phosphate kinase/D-beta-D-heptose 1-phosphate adenosyltransferase
MKKAKRTAVVVSGYFNPVHKGHLELFENAKSLGDILIVIVNSDLQRELKGSKAFMNEDERLLIIETLKTVDFALISSDEDKTQCKTIAEIFAMFSKRFNIIFANGGDQTNQSIPEADTCNFLNIKMVDGLGKKVQSSSWLLKQL